jgi:hypothetical protein
MLVMYICLNTQAYSSTYRLAFSAASRLSNRWIADIRNLVHRMSLAIARRIVSRLVPMPTPPFFQRTWSYFMPPVASAR